MAVCIWILNRIGCGFIFMQKHIVGFLPHQTLSHFKWIMNTMLIWLSEMEKSDDLLTLSKSFATWKVKLPRIQRRYWSYTHRHLKGKLKLYKDAAIEELEQRLLKKFLGKKKIRQQKRDHIKHQQWSLCVSVSVDICVSSRAWMSPSPVFHVWNCFRDCKYLGILWQWTIPWTWLGNWCLHPELCSYLSSSENGHDKGSTVTRSSITETICNFFPIFCSLVLHLIYYCEWRLKTPFKVPGLSTLFLVLRRTKHYLNELLSLSAVLLVGHLLMRNITSCFYTKITHHRYPSSL